MNIWTKRLLIVYCVLSYPATMMMLKTTDVPVFSDERSATVNAFATLSAPVALPLIALIEFYYEPKPVDIEQAGS